MLVCLSLMDLMDLYLDSGSVALTVSRQEYHSNKSWAGAGAPPSVVYLFAHRTHLSDMSASMCGCNHANGHYISENMFVYTQKKNYFLYILYTRMRIYFRLLGFILEQLFNSQKLVDGLYGCTGLYKCIWLGTYATCHSTETADRLHGALL